MITWKLEVIAAVVLSTIFCRSTLEWFRRHFRRSDDTHLCWQFQKARLFHFYLKKKVYF